MKLTADYIATLYDRQAADVLRYFARRTFDPEVAVDLLSETFARAIADRHQFRGRSDSEAIGWIYSIARSQLLDFWRRGRNERAAMARLGVDRRPLTDVEYDRVEGLMALHGIRDRLAEELEGLPPQQREAVQLRVIEERSYDEVAAAIGTSEDNARARVSRGLKALRETPVIKELQEEPRYA